MVFSVLYSPLVGIIGGGIFNYFQMVASYLAVPIATVFLVGILWKGATPDAAFTVMVAGIPLGLLINWLIPHVFDSETVTRYSLNNFFIVSGVTQAWCVILMVTVSLFTQPKPGESIASLLLTKETLMLPQNEPKRPFYQSFLVWWFIFTSMYVIFYIILW